MQQRRRAGDVGQHRRGRRIRVTRQDRDDNGIVLVVGVDNIAPQQGNSIQ